MKSAFLLAIPALLAGGATMNAAVDPALLALMPANASLLFGVQVHNVLASPFGRFLLTQLPANNGMVQLAASTGFDYRNDLTEIVGATVLPDGTKANVVFARGNFQVKKFLALATATGSTITGYKAAQIVSLPNSDNTSVGFLDATTVVIGSMAGVQAAADRYVAHSQFAGPLAAKATAVSASGDAWIATVTPADQFVKASATPMPGMFKPVLETAASVQFNNTGAVAAGELTTASGVQAQGLLAILKFVAQMAAAATKSDANSAQTSALLSAAQFAVNGTTLSVTLPIPEQTLEQMYSERPKATNKASIR
jgi:hypothetical protein